MAELKHVGRVKATNKKCLVAYRTLPGDAYHCLIVPTENLPDAHHDAIINLVESSSGQEAYEFAEAMDRSQFSDGSRMLPALHAAGRLIKAPTADIEMTPTTGFSILLSELNQIIAEQRGVAVDELALKSGSPEAEKKTDDSNATKISLPSETETTTPSTPEAQAKEYRSKADKLAKEAAQYRRLAEELVPTKKLIK